MVQKKEYVTMTTFLSREKRIGTLITNNIEIIYTTSRAKIVLGCMSLVIAVIPNGLGVIFYPLGITLLASGGVDLYSLYKKLADRYRFTIWKLKRGWLY